MREEFNPFSLRNKKILITGASSGIGKAAAIMCCKMGAFTIITGRDEKRLEETAECIGKDNYLSITADLAYTEGRNHLLDHIDKLDGVVLAAGFVEMWPVLFASEEKFEKIFKTNLYSPIELLRSIIRKKLYNKGFSAVLIDSIAGNENFVSGNCIYGSGKAALKSFMKFFALEIASKGVRINSVSPGLINTPMHTKGSLSEEDMNNMNKKIPLARWGSPEDIAPAIIYLLSDASSYMTGSNIIIDGGYTI